MLSFLSIFACIDFGDPSYVSELRVMAVQSEPAEFSPLDESLQLNILVADPKKQTAEALIWPCTNLGNGCLEAEFFEGNLENWVSVIELSEGINSFSLSLPLELGFLLSDIPEEDLPLNLTSIWILACPPEECSAIEKVKAGQIDAGKLGDPSQFLVNLPMNTASLAKRSLFLSNRSLETRIQNPILSPQTDEIPTSAPNQDNEIQISYALQSLESEGSRFSVYTSLGSIVEERGPPGSSEPMDLEGEYPIQWNSGSEPGSGFLYVIVENSDGGIGLWTESLSVVVPATQ